MTNKVIRHHVDINLHLSKIVYLNQCEKSTSERKCRRATELLNADYYQTAINAAVRGDRAGAEAALDKRAEKMESPLYRGNGGTSMEEARQYIDGLLAASEGAEISEEAVREDPLLSKSEWKEYRAEGIGAESVYPTYEDYVSNWLKYMTEVPV